MSKKEIVVCNVGEMCGPVSGCHHAVPHKIEATCENDACMLNGDGVCMPVDQCGICGSKEHTGDKCFRVSKRTGLVTTG